MGVLAVLGGDVTAAAAEVKGIAERGTGLLTAHLEGRAGQ